MVEPVRSLDVAAVGAIEPTGAEPLRPCAVHHYIRRDVPGYIAAALEARFLGVEISLVEVVGTRNATSALHARFEAAETAGDAALEVLVELVVASARRHGQYFRNQVEVDRPEERGLLDLTRGVF